MIRLRHLITELDKSKSDELIDPASSINPNKIGSATYSTSGIANNFSSAGYKNGQIPLKAMTAIGSGADRRFYSDGQFRMHPTVAAAYKQFSSALQSAGISARLSSAYRSSSHQSTLQGQGNAAAPGSSAHGWGGAFDIANLYNAAGGSTSPSINAKIRKSNPLYSKVANIAKDYGFYNPWRLSDGTGMDECWHFEYWG